MPSYSRRQQNSNSGNLVFLTPVVSSEGTKSKNQYRHRFNSFPSWNKQPNSVSHPNIKDDQIAPNSRSLYTRKRRNENSTTNRKDIVLVVDDEPDSKRRKSLIPEKSPHPVNPSYFDLVILKYLLLILV